MRRVSFLIPIFLCAASFYALALPPLGGPKGPPPPRPVGSMDRGQPIDHPNASQEPKIDFHSQTILVQVPVVVVDKGGNHVSGLTKDSFQVLENGKAQKIATFEEFKSSSQPLGREATPADTFSNSIASSDHPHNVLVIVLDTVNTPFLDQVYGRKALISYLAGNLDPGQRYALVTLTTSGVHLIHAPTDDPAILIEAVKRLKGELSTVEDRDREALTRALAAGDVSFSPSSPTADPYDQLGRLVLNGDAGIAQLQQDRAIEATMRGFLSISWALAGLPGRKSLIWATGSFPFFVDSPGAVPAHLADLYERTMKTLNDSEISVYPVDVRGLVSAGSVVSASSHGRVATLPQQLVARYWLQDSTIDTLRDFAEMTGGRAFYNTNDIATSFRRASDDSAAYYVVSYYLNTANRNPGWRKLKVKVSRADVDVRSRSGFFVTNATVNHAPFAKVDLSFAVNSPFDCTGVPMSVQWTGTPPAEAQSSPGRVTDKAGKQVGFLLRVAGNGVAIEPSETNRFNLDVLAYAFTSNEANTAASFAKNFEGSLSEAQLPKFREKGFGFRNALDLPPGKYTVRFVVRDNLSGRVGSVAAPVTVN